jgi:hypothetical protein
VVFNSSMSAAPPPPSQYPPPQYPPQPPYQQQPPYQPPPPPKPKSRTGLIVAVVIVVVVVIALVVVAVLAADRVFFPKSTAPTLTRQTHNLVNTQSGTFGPGTTGAVVVGFIIPTVGGSWVNGTFSVTACTSIGNYCLANAWLFTPSAWANYMSGGTVTGTCLTQVIAGQCQSEQNVQIASGDLSSFAGQTLDLCLWSNATTESQMYFADVNFTYYVGVVTST